MNKHANVIYADVNEKFVNAVVLFPNGSNVLHYDEALTMAILPDDLANLAIKDLVLVNKEGTYIKPVSVTPGNEAKGVKFTSIVANAGEAATFKSAEYPAKED